VNQVPRMTEEQPRSRVLTDDEVRRLWNALEAEAAKPRNILQLALLTAQRRGELMGVRWEELDLHASSWTLPAGRSKNGTRHRVYLAPMAKKMLNDLKANAKADDPLVFRGGRIGKPVTNPQKWLARIRDVADLKDFRMHDLRRTAASRMTSIGIPR